MASAPTGRTARFVCTAAALAKRCHHLGLALAELAADAAVLDDRGVDHAGTDGGDADLVMGELVAQRQAEPREIDLKPSIQLKHMRSRALP